MHYQHVSKDQIFDGIKFDPAYVRRALGGDILGLHCAFVWNDDRKMGGSFWARQADLLESGKPLEAEAEGRLRDMLNVANYRARLKCQAETRDPDSYDQFDKENN